ncbi:MAG: PSD1 and planctomycete cytochrome C domain-containing protein [Pirellulaceae bacterium]|nr:PSD1 and planctomycete cytochrome C domain-containing protein [Pirellulaceae bacterium]
MIKPVLLTPLFVIITCGAMIADDKRAEFFEKRIRPILVEHCHECHGPDEASGELRLDTKAGWMRGGEGGPAIVPGDPSTSLLIRAVKYEDEELQMPPSDEGGKLSVRQVDDLSAWIRQGAFDPRTGDDVARSVDETAKNHWAFQPISPPHVPPSQHPVDYLIDRQLKEQGLIPTAAAEMPKLIRRATYDLHGLPPSREQLATPHDKFQQLVSELLASPRYGERWGRHWLDVARYSDAKDGVLMYGDARIRPFAYTYRDYVVRAFNEDKPFDQFVREQIAADQMDLPDNSADLAAMGLLTLGRMFDGNPHDIIDDQIDVIARGFLGLTAGCARCHDHKSDPLSMADYYSLYGVFASSIEPYERPRIEDISEPGQAYETELDKKLEEVFTTRQAHYQRTLETARDRIADYLVRVATTEPDLSETASFFLSLTPEQLRPQITFRWRKMIARRAHPEDPIFGPWHDMMREPKLRADHWRQRGVDQRIIDGLVAAKPKTPKEIARAYGEIIRSVWAREKELRAELDSPDSDALADLLLSNESPVWFPENEIYYYLSRQQKDAFRGLVNQLDAISVKHKAAAGRAMVMVDAESLYDPVIFQRGDPALPGTPVPRQFLRIASGEHRSPFANGSGRIDLANAIVSSENPLTARVWVNRVWMHHFGEPLVENPSDFGLRTKRPVYHELLDYLAAKFIENGWRTKPLHELIMTSAAYRRASEIDLTEKMVNQIELDPDNRFFWRANRRRLDLEQMRDTMLVISGKIDYTMYGRPPSITDLANYRRTIYAFVERQNLPNIIQTFDSANADASTARRVTTTVPQQALFAMNSEFIAQTAQALATRISEGSDAERVAKIYGIALGRTPSTEELELGISFVKTNPWKQYAHILLMTNELMFVD